MNIYSLIETYRWWKGKNYINKNTYDVLQENEYQELPEEEKENYALAPKFHLSKQVKWARKFLKTLPFPYEDSVERIENFYMKEFETDFMHGFHIFCEDHKIWEDFIYFQEAEEVNDIIKWCKKYNISYDTESPEERQVKRFLKSINDNERKLEFNARYTHSNDYMNEFELFCKENGIWEKFLEFQKEEEEEYWRQFFEENRDKEE